MEENKELLFTVISLTHGNNIHWEMFPTHIPNSAFSKLGEIKLTSNRDGTLISTWYGKDSYNVWNLADIGNQLGIDLWNIIEQKCTISLKTMKMIEDTFKDKLEEIYEWHH